MKLNELIKGLNYLKITKDTDIEIKNLTINSKAVTPFDLFICITGKSTDGHNFYKEALFNGAKALVVEKELDTEICQIVVKDSREAMNILSETFFDYPSKKLKMIGITGTNGKTTTSYMIKSILDTAGKKTGIIGTLGIYYSNKQIAPELTTPDPICLNKTLADMVDSGVEYVVMEVSAHAIFYNKIGNIKFEIGIFTNLTQDHLDFFKTIDKYREAKASFFNKKHIKSAVMNFDDLSSQYICEKCDVPYISYGLKNPSDVFAIDIEQTIGGCSFVINLLDDIKEIKMRLLGEFNVSNALAAATACKLIGIETDTIAEGILNLKKVDGRLEYAGNFNGGDIFVDFAHTPDGLKKILESLRALNPTKLICLFGCGGNRDKLKRPIMGEIVGQNADFSIVTSDNPRYEDPLDIISDIEIGLRKVTKKYVTVQDRISAIDYAIKLLTQGDILVISGKGGENYQEIMGIKHTYNDNAVINEILYKLK